MAVSEGKTVPEEDGDKSSGLATTVKKGALWVLVSRVLVVVVAVGGSMVLARLLEPREFGIFGMAMLFTHLATRVGNIGFGSALIRHQAMREEHVSSVFVINLVVWPSVTAILVLASPYVARFFDVPEIEAVLAVLALTFLTKPFTSVARALMQRQMNFKGPAVATVLSHYATVAVTVVLAWLGYRVWSLVIGEIIGVIVLTISLLFLSRWVPKLRYSHAAAKELFSFGIYIFFKELLVYSSDKIDVLFIGKLLGAAHLAFYERAFRLMNISIKELIRKLGPVLFSALSKFQEDRPRLVSAYHKVSQRLSLLLYPVFFGMIVVAPSLIYVMFGEKWMPSVVPLQILCLAGVFRLNLELTGVVINAMGIVAFEVKRRIAMLGLLAIGCWIGSQWGLPGVAIAVTVATSFLAILMMVYLAKVTGLGMKDLLTPQFPAIIASIGMMGIIWTYQLWAEVALGPHSLSILVSSVTIGAICYVGALFLLKPAMVKSLYGEFCGDLLMMKQKIAG